MAILTGTTASETLTGTASEDTITGGAGNDYITGGIGNDTLNGNLGADTVLGGDGADTVSGGQGNDVINGNQGEDILINGNLGNDTVSGGQGNDSNVRGGQGDDIVNGSLGNDTVFGDLGNDTMHGGKEDDIVHGGGGIDWIFGDLGNDTLTGGEALDRFSFSAGHGTDVLTDFVAGTDKLYLSGLGFNTPAEVLAAYSGGMITTSGGTITLTGAPMLAESDIIILGGAGTTGTSGGGGGSSNLLLTGDNNANTLAGGSGNDTILGNGGNDVVTGGNGNDIIRAGEGTDNVDAGSGGGDIIIVVGITSTNQYSSSDFTSVGPDGVDLSGVLTTANVNGRATSEISGNETIDGGAAGADLVIYGTVDLTGVTLLNINRVIVNSDLTLNDSQLASAGINSLAGAGRSSVIRLANDTGSVDFGSVAVDDVGLLDLKDGVVAEITQAKFDEIDFLRTGDNTSGIQDASGAGLDFSNHRVMGDGLSLNNGAVSQGAISTVAAGLEEQARITITGAATGAGTLTFNIGNQGDDGAPTDNGGTGTATTAGLAISIDLAGGETTDQIATAIAGAIREEWFKAFQAAADPDEEFGTGLVDVAGSVITLTRIPILPGEADAQGGIRMWGFAAGGSGATVTINNAFRAQSAGDGGEDVTKESIDINNAMAAALNQFYGLSFPTVDDGTLVATTGRDGEDDDILGADGQNNFIDGALGNDTLTGGDGDDFLDGGGETVNPNEDDDSILGMAGDDRLAGLDGDDYMDGGADDDMLEGEAGADTLIGGTGSDFLTGGEDDDELDGGAGANLLIGGTGADDITLGADVDIVAYIDTGDEVEEISGIVSMDTVDGFDFNEDIWDFSTFSAFDISSVASVNTGGTALNAASLAADLETAIDADLIADRALLVLAGSGDLSGRLFLVVDGDGVAGWDSNAAGGYDDFVIELTNAANTGGFAVGDFL